MSARANIDELLLDASLAPQQIRIKERKWRDHEVRPGGASYRKFLLHLGARRCNVWMPDETLDKSRFKNGHFLFPRVYVNGSSYFWEYASVPLRECLTSRMPEPIRVLRNAEGEYLREWVETAARRPFALQWVPEQGRAHRFEGLAYDDLKRLRRAFKGTIVCLTPVNNAGAQ